EFIDNKIEEGKITEYKSDEFKKRKKIGGGAYSIVYKAIIINAENAEKMYALKVIENDAHIDNEIMNELENMLSVDHHQNIIKFYGVTKFKDLMDEDIVKYALVLEYADSGTLCDFLQNNATEIEWELKFQFAIQLAEGLREKPIPGTNERYIGIYKKCWQNKQSDRPTINEVLIGLNDIVNPFYKDLSYHDVSVSEIDISEFEEFFKEYVNTIFNEPPKTPLTIELHANAQDPKTTFINGLYLKFCDMFNKGMSVPRTIKNYISKNGESESVVLNWLYLKEEPKYVCLRGIFYMWNIGTEEGNKMDVFSLFLNAGNRDEVVAQYFVGRCFEVGWNTRKKLKKALEWYNKAINNGSTAAERVLGDYFYKCQEYSQAFKLLKSAYEKGNILAMHNLGLCYKLGRGTDINMKEGFALLKQAAEMGVPNSPYELARCYEYAEGTEKDLKVAFDWYQTSLNNGQKCHDDRERVMVKIMKEQTKSNVTK
ncbi:6366_t:CDS:2, partial [Cetraspora pellucida]